MTDKDNPNKGELIISTNRSLAIKSSLVKRGLELASATIEQSKTILIVKQHIAVFLLIKEEFKDDGFQFVQFIHATTAKEALEIIRTRDIDIVISEINPHRNISKYEANFCVREGVDFPDVSGDLIELLRLVKESWPELPFIIFTCYGETMKDFSTSAADEYLQASVDLDDLKAVVRKYLGRRPRRSWREGN